MAKEIYLSGMTADQLSEMIRESLRDELQQLRPVQPKTDTKYLTRHETARRQRISLVARSAPTKSAGVSCFATATSKQL